MSTPISPPVSSANPPSNETPNQKAARLRRERREAKLKSEGNSRLEKITQLSGRQNFPAETVAQNINLGRNINASVGNADEEPDEVDLSMHPSASVGHGPPGANGQQLPPWMVSMPGSQQQQQNQQDSFGLGTVPPGPSGAEDPMMAMLQQLMGGGGDPSNSNGGGMPGLPPGLAAMLGAGGAGGSGEGGGGGGAGFPPTQAQGMPIPASTAQAITSAAIWRIIHTVSVAILALYVSLSAFPSTTALHPSSTKTINLFWAFSTIELLLQSARYFLGSRSANITKGPDPQAAAALFSTLTGAGAGASAGGLNGIISLLTNFIPEPYKSYLKLAMRYVKMAMTVLEDGLVVVFVLGCVAIFRYGNATAVQRGAAAGGSGVGIGIGSIK